MKQLVKYRGFKEVQRQKVIDGVILILRDRTVKGENGFVCIRERYLQEGFKTVDGTQFNRSSEISKVETVSRRSAKRHYDKFLAEVKGEAQARLQAQQEILKAKPESAPKPQRSILLQAAGQAV